MRCIVKACRRPPTVRMGDRNGGSPRLSDNVACGLRCPASPRRTLLAENHGEPSLWVIITVPWYFVPAWPWGAYLGQDALENGVDVGVSSWQRAHGNTFPGMAKAAGHYNNAQLIKFEAQANGYTEGIALTTAGTISEGSGQNLFAVIDGELLTPSIEGSNLQGVTRASVFQLAEDLDIPLRETVMPREILYVADELFFSGTATEITPIRSVDRIEVGEGSMGPITCRLQERFLAIVRGEHKNNHGWLTPVN